MTRRLKQWALEAQEEFEKFSKDSGGCSCHINPPCGYCTHPGHPLALEDDDCWEDEPNDLWASIAEASGGRS